MKKVIFALVLFITLLNLYFFIENSIYVKDKDLYGVYIPTTKNCFKCDGMKFEINRTTVHIVCKYEHNFPQTVKYYRKWNNLYYDTENIKDDFLILPTKIDVTYKFFETETYLYYWRGDEDFCIAKKVSG